MNIYAMGVMQLDFELRNPIRSTRLWELYRRFDDAEETVLLNRGDIFEYYYNYALIEEVAVVPSRGKYTIPKQQWYYADYYTKDKFSVVVSKVDVPKQFKNTFCWWVG